MEDINTLYYNTFGIAFQWKRTAARDYRKIQLVFKNIGLFLTSEELEEAKDLIDGTLFQLQLSGMLKDLL